VADDEELPHSHAPTRQLPSPLDGDVEDAEKLAEVYRLRARRDRLDNETSREAQAQAVREAQAEAVREAAAATQRFSRDAKTAARQLASIGLPVPATLKQPRAVVRVRPGAPLPAHAPPPPEPLVLVRPAPYVLPIRSQMRAGEWGRVNEGGGQINYGHLALVDGEGSICLVARRTAEEIKKFLSGRKDSPSELEVNFKLCRPRLRNRKTNEITLPEDVLTRFAQPTWDELGLWEARAGGPLRVMPTSCPGLRLAPGCRVVVPALVQGGLRETAAGWVITVEESRARVRISKPGEAIQQTNDTLRNFLVAKPRPGLDQDLVVEITDLRRHVLSFPAELRVLDRVMVTGLGRGRVKAIPVPVVEEDPAVKVVLESDEEVEIPMSFVTRVFKVGDVVDVVGGPFIGAWGIIVRVDDPKDGPSADIFAVSSPPTGIGHHF
jgi:hypothetical protein